MTWTVRVEPEAEADAIAAADWYEARRAGLGAEFVVALGTVLANLAEGPERYARLGASPSYRRARLVRFPHSAIFSIVEREVRVVAVAHGRREPGYWIREDEP